MINEKKCCRRCHKKRAVVNKSRGWCRSCLDKINRKFHILKVLPHPEKYDDILDLWVGGNKTQAEIADAVGRSRQTVQGIIARYTIMVDENGTAKPV